MWWVITWLDTSDPRHYL